MFAWTLRLFAVGVLFLAIAGAQSLFGGGLPWWGSLLAAAGAYIAAAFCVKRLFLGALTAPFKMKGAVLRGARLVVHSVEKVAAPVRARSLAACAAGTGEGRADAADGCESDCDEESDSTRDVPADWRWYRVDATVTPPGLGTGPFRSWAPCDLTMVSLDADTSPSAPSDDGMASIHGREVHVDGAWIDDEGMTFEGEQRIRFMVACAPTLAVAKLRYYFEGVGRIDLP